MDSGEIDRVISTVLGNAQAHLAAVYRFGSSAHGLARPESDLDIAILPTAAVDPDDWFELREQLTTALGREVDLMDLSTTSPVMAMEVLTSGRLIFECDALMRGRFEDHTFGAYARLNEERRGILERIAAEGTVYGR